MSVPATIAEHFDRVHAGGRKSAVPRMLLYGFVVSIALLPIRFDFFKYLILIIFSLIFFSCIVTWRQRPHIPWTPLYAPVLLLIGIYLAWLPLSLLYGNDLVLLLKDSAGFPLYAVFPVLFAFVITNRLQQDLVDAIVFAATTIAAIHIVTFVGFYLVFPTLSYVNLAGANSALASLGFTWELGSTNGILRANTKGGHFLILGMALLFSGAVAARKPSRVLLLGVLFVGALFDGHKALVAALLLFGLLALPIIVSVIRANPVKTVVFAALGVPAIVTFVGAFLDPGAFAERFLALGSSSFTVRAGQIESLLVEIANRPFFGNGFGASAGIIRSEIRPFMYEVDFLAVAMKLGVIGAALYFALYFRCLSYALSPSLGSRGFVLFSAGVAYFFYMGTNGGFAMSPISAFFHVLLFTCIAGRLYASPTEASGFAAQTQGHPGRVAGI